MKKTATPEAKVKQPSSGRLVAWIVRLPRLSRIVIAALFALALTLAITPVIDGFYLDHFYNASTAMLPALVSTGLGLVFYVIGWRLIIGYAGEYPPARPAIFWYLSIGVVACLAVVILIVLGAISGSVE